MTQERNNHGFNLNTILLSIVVGVLSWVGYTTQQTSVSIAVIAEKIAYNDRELLSLRTRVAQIELSLAKYRLSP